MCFRNVAGQERGRERADRWEGWCNTEEEVERGQAGMGGGCNIYAFMSIFHCRGEYEKPVGGFRKFKPVGGFRKMLKIPVGGFRTC